jgi:cyanophycinase
MRPRTISLLLPLLLLGASVLPSPSGPGDPGGQLVIVGGGTPSPRILRRFVALAGGERSQLIVLPMASEDPAGSGKSASESLGQAGARSVDVLILTREMADTPSALAPLRAASGIFFSGGDQSRLTRALKDTKAETLLHDLLHGGVVLAGTSAGAAVMSEIMITGEEKRRVPEDGDAFTTIEADNVVTAPGFGFLRGVIVDQHFVRRRRSNRLMSLVLENPACLGVGIDEETGIWVKPDRTFEVIGEGPVVVFDAHAAKVRRNGERLEADGVTLHVLRDGSLFDLDARRVVRLGAP